jgi:hypothetical protein
MKNGSESVDLYLSPPVGCVLLVLIVSCKLLSQVLCVAQTNIYKKLQRRRLRADTGSTMVPSMATMPLWSKPTVELQRWSIVKAIDYC